MFAERPALDGCGYAWRDATSSAMAPTLVAPGYSAQQVGQHGPGLPGILVVHGLEPKRPSREHVVLNIIDERAFLRREAEPARCEKEDLLLRFAHSDLS